MASKRLELVHTDLCGPIRCENVTVKYIITFLDDYSRYLKIFLLENKLSETIFSAFMKCYSWSQNATGESFKTLRSDNGTEYSQVKDFLKNNGLQWQHSTVYTPESNGRAERVNRTLFEKIRSLLHGGSIPNFLWPEIANTSVYLYNILPSSAIQNNIPHQKFHETEHPPNITHLRKIGCVCYSHIPSQKRSKLCSKAKFLYLIGYSEESKAYRLYDPTNASIFESRDIRFDEMQTFSNIDSRESELQIDDDSEVPVRYQEKSEYQVRQILDERRRGRGKQYLVSWEDESLLYSWEPASNLINCKALDDWENQQCLIATEAPKTYQEAINSKDSAEWVGAMTEEFNSLIDHNVWKIVDRPRGRQVVTGKWVFKRKINQNHMPMRFKARYVARGYTQREGVDYWETFSPTVSKETLRVFIANCACRCWDIVHLDVKTAFLNGPIDTELYLEQPLGCDNIQTPRSTHVCLLEKSIYGLKQSSRLWNQKFDTIIRSIKFIQSEADQCLYTLICDNKICAAIVIYVDDILLATGDVNIMNSTKESLSNHFEITDLGRASHILGISIHVHPEQGLIRLNQTQYIRKILEENGMQDCKISSTPFDNTPATLSNNTSNNLVDKNWYQSVIGSLLYL